MTRRPSSVTVGAHRHPIFWTDKRISKKGLLGRAHRVHGGIEVTKDQSLTQQGSTLIHEILHHAFYDGPTAHFAGWNDEVEEAVIAAVEGKLLELFVRPENRPVVKWLKSLVH